MKGKRYTTETKIRILREAEGSHKSIQDVCRDRQISEQTYHCWKREFGTSHGVWGFAAAPVGAGGEMVFD